MSIFKNALTASLGLEDDAPNVQVNIDTDETGMPIDNVTEDGENTPEADEVEIIEDSSEIEADNEVIEEMAEAADSLESIYIAMESAQTNGGLTREAATFASIAVENIVRKYGVSSEDMGISLESFNDNRAQATTVSMEGVGQALKDLWDAIVTKFQAMIKKIVDFYYKTIAAAPRIKRRAEALRKKARSTNGTAKEKSIKTGLFNSLNVAGDVPKFSELQAALKAVTSQVKTNTKQNDIVANAQTMFASFTGAGADGGSDAVADKMAKKLGFTGIGGTAGNFALTGTAASNIKIGTSNATVVILSQRGMPGNKQFFSGAVAGSERANAIDALRDFKTGVFTDNNDLKADKASQRDKEWPVLGTSEVEGLCDLVIKCMENIIAEKTQADKKLNGVKIMKKEGEKLINKIEGTDKAAAKAAASRTLQITVDVSRQASQGEAAVMSYTYRTSKAILAYCARSLGQYKNA